MKAKAPWWGSRLVRQSMRAVVAYLRRALPHRGTAISSPLARARDVAPCYARVPSLSRRGVSPSVARPPVPRCLPLARFLAASRSLPRAPAPRSVYVCAHLCTYARRAVLLFEPGRPAGRHSQASRTNAAPRI